MSQDKREQLSTLMDDELAPTAVEVALDVSSSDRELRALWDRYHLIGDALRGEPLSREVMRVAERVWESLDGEPAILLPRRAPGRPRWVGPVLGSALGASLAVVAIVVGPGFLGGDTPTQLEVASDEGPPEALYVDHTGTYWNLQRPEVESKLNSYLVNHQEYAPATGMKGMLPYTTFVSYDARR